VSKVDCVYCEDCLVGMKRIPDGSVDMILCDLPYGTTANAWDNVIPLEPLWEQYKRVIKPRGAIVLTSQQPFASILVASNPRWFRHEWIWEKNVATGFVNANRMPLRAHENVLVFALGAVLYNPQKTPGKPYSERRTGVSPNLNAVIRNNTTNLDGSRHPRSVQKFKRESGQFHPTQKPVALFEYLIRTYTNVGETVLDNCMGSGTTAIAAINGGRHYIGFENDGKYFELARQRIAQASKSMAAAA
jgi:site-specific DNA-methyltransferase (adenine-specific)